MIVVPKRNAFQRALNRAGHRFGIKPFPVAFENGMPAQLSSDTQSVFNAIHDSNYWGSTESLSGGGSEVLRTAEYRRQLVDAIKHFGIRSIFDAPCGDLNWMRLVLDQVDVRYIGGDIADQALAAARQRRPDLDLRHFDVCSDPFPKADLWHCRDSLFHLSFYDIWRALRRMFESECTYAAITTHRARLLRNIDIETGGWRLLDMERSPWRFTKPLVYLKDYLPGEFPRYVGIWRIADLLKRRPE